MHGDGYLKVLTMIVIFCRFIVESLGMNLFTLGTSNRGSGVRLIITILGYFHSYFDKESHNYTGQNVDCAECSFARIVTSCYSFRSLTHSCPPFQHLLSERLTSLGIIGEIRVPPLCRETSVSRTANVGTVGKNWLISGGWTLPKSLLLLLKFSG